MAEDSGITMDILIFIIYVYNINYYCIHLYLGRLYLPDNASTLFRRRCEF